SNIESFNESLVEETLQEAADTFFGQRREVERAVEKFQENVEKLRRIQAGVETCQANLHYLFCRGQAELVSGFYRAIDVDPECVPGIDQEAAAEPDQLRLPFGLLPKSRYAKAVRAAFARFASEANDYMNGRYYNDPEEPQRKRITVHYRQLEDMCRHVNERIKKVNQYNSPSEVLQFCKQFDMECAEKERLVGVPLQYNLDQEMAFPLLDFAGACLVAYPDLPSPDEVKNNIKEYSARIFAEHSDEIRSLMKALGSGQS
ncbi:MAG: hypothetical protein ACOC9D_06965, partial [Thermodesulfobacteriota bacterium]